MRLVLCGLVAFAAGLVALAPRDGARAYELLGGEWPSISGLKICIDTSYPGTSSSWSLAGTLWNATSTPFSPDYECSGDTDVSLDDDSFPSTIDGWAVLYPSPSSDPYTFAYAAINYFVTEWYSSERETSVASHEYGHVFGLDHEGGCVLMYANTDTRYGTCGIYAPQSDDVDGVNAIY